VKVYRLPPKIAALIFDMDLTLYSNTAYGQFQIDSLVERLGRREGKSFTEIRDQVEERRKTLAFSRGGRKPSLSDVLLSFGVSMEENIRWREEAYEPEKYIREDPSLWKTLESLSASFALAVVTNNPLLIARRTLAALGVEDLFGTMIGLDSSGVSKPHKKPFLMAVRSLGLPPETCVSIGDRYDIDLAPALEIGMGAILVDGVEDVYNLGPIEKGSIGQRC
jgi:phosphoglycolate phosphatase/putative hydrolase of the HAD superfamily